MADGEDLAHHSIIQEEIITIANSHPSKNDKTPIKKTFKFLKPCTQHLNQAVPIPNTPLLSEIFPQNLPHWPSKVVFRGWLFPQTRWKEWLNRLSPKYSPIWKQSAIYDAIMSSIYVVPQNNTLILGLSEYWSSETNTFVFPWGEATITLEDTMILGGYPVLGEDNQTSINKDLIKIERGLEEHRIGLIRSKAKKAEHSIWMNYFMDKKSDLEHEAFLSLWLSRYVFPNNSLSIGNYVFPIAAKLSQGIKVALAPAVLANIYRDLRCLKEGAIEAKETIQVWGLFQLIQLWIFEHFPIFRPKSLNCLKAGEPRVAFWHNLSSKDNNLPSARSAFRVFEAFEWRPYAADLVNWRHLSYYGERETIIFSNDSSLDFGFCSFFKCLSAREIGGLDSVEDYFPHRVAMQFGYDQDLPSDPMAFELAAENIKFFVPSKSFRGCTTERYSKWFKDMMFTRDIAIRRALKKEKYSKILKASLLEFSSKEGMEEFYESSDDEERFFSSKKSIVAPIAKADLSDDDNIPIGTLFYTDSKATIDFGTGFLRNSAKQTVDGNSLKRAHISRDEILAKKKSANSVLTHVEGNTESTIKVKNELSFFTDEQLETELPKIGENLTNVVSEARKLEEAGDWFNPIEIED